MGKMLASPSRAAVFHVIRGYPEGAARLGRDSTGSGGGVAKLGGGQWLAVEVHSTAGDCVVSLEGSPGTGYLRHGGHGARLNQAVGGASEGHPVLRQPDIRFPAAQRDDPAAHLLGGGGSLGIGCASPEQDAEDAGPPGAAGTSEHRVDRGRGGGWSGSVSGSNGRVAPAGTRGGIRRRLSRGAARAGQAHRDAAQAPETESHAGRTRSRSHGAIIPVVPHPARSRSVAPALSGR